MPSSHRRVVVTQRFFDDTTTAYLEARGCEVIVPDIARDAGDAHLDRDQLTSLLKDAAGWIIGQAYVTRALLEGLPGLLALSRRGVGYDRIDVAAVADLGRVLTIAAGGNDASVADHTLALMLGVARRIRESQMLMAASSKAVPVGTDLNRKTVGIVGLGRIARTVIRRLSGFDVRVLVAAPERHADTARALGAEPVALPTLLRESDYVTLHCPLTAATRFMIDKAAIASMKPTAILVNTSRGGLVDDAALLDALRAGHLAGAGLDVFVSEAEAASQAVTDALIALPNVLATPHAAASSREGIIETNKVAAENVVAVLDGGVPAEGRLIVDGRR